MAHNVEPMDIDSSVCDFDNKENSLHYNNVLPRSPCTEKGYEELDVSELNMKLRYSITPTGSPMSKSFTSNCIDNRMYDAVDNAALLNDNTSLTRSLNSTLTKTDSILKSQKILPLQALPNDQLSDGNRNVLRKIESPDNNIIITVSETKETDDLSLPSSSSSLTQTPEATTPTKDIPKSDGGSPIMRSLKSVFNMFRPSQSPIPPTEDDNAAIKPDMLSPPVINSPEAETKSSSMLASTPLAAHKTKDALSKRSSPNRDNIVFNDDLEKELQWKDETTILFSKEKIPIHKLFLPHLTPSNPTENTKGAMVSTSQESTEKHNRTVEYMDISYNDVADNYKIITDIQSEETKLATESDSEFLDCESFTKNQSEIEISFQTPLEPIMIYNNDPAAEITSEDNILSENDCTLNATKSESSIENQSGTEILFIAPVDPLMICSNEPENKIISNNNGLDESNGTLNTIIPGKCIVKSIIKEECKVIHVNEDAIERPQNQENLVKEEKLEVKEVVSEDIKTAHCEVIITDQISLSKGVPSVTDIEAINSANLTDSHVKKEFEVNQDAIESVEGADIEELMPKQLPISVSNDPIAPAVSEIEIPSFTKLTENHVENDTIDEKYINLNTSPLHSNSSSASEIDNKVVFNNSATTVPLESIGITSISKIPLIADPRVLLFNIDNQKPTHDISEILTDTCPANIPLPDDDEAVSLPTIALSVGETETKNDAILNFSAEYLNKDCLEKTISLSAESFDEDSKNVLYDNKTTIIEEDYKNNYSYQDTHEIKILGNINATQNSVLEKGIGLRSNKDIITFENQDEKENLKMVIATCINDSDITQKPSVLEQESLDDVTKNTSFLVKDIPCNLKESSSNITKPIVEDGRQVNNPLNEDNLDTVLNEFDRATVENISNENSIQNREPLFINSDVNTNNQIILPMEAMSENYQQLDNSLKLNEININFEKVNNTSSCNGQLQNEVIDNGQLLNYKTNEIPENGKKVTEEQKIPSNVEINTRTASENSAAFVATEIKIEHSAPTDKTMESGTAELVLLSCTDETESVLPLPLKETLLINTAIVTEPYNAISTGDLNINGEELDLICEDIVTSENTSPFVSVSTDSGLPIEDKPIKNIAEIERPLPTNIKMNISPPASPKIVSKGYNFNFDEVDDPFATKTKVRMSPPPFLTSPNQVLEKKVKDIPKKDIKDGRKFELQNRKKFVTNKMFNPTFDTISNICNETQGNTEKLPTIETIQNADMLPKDKAAATADKTFNNMDEKYSAYGPSDTVIAPIEMSKGDSSCLLENKTVNLVHFVANEENRPSNESELKNVKGSSSEQSGYHSADTLPDEGTAPKNVFNLPEIDDSNFNPLAIKAKLEPWISADNTVPELSDDGLDGTTDVQLPSIESIANTETNGGEEKSFSCNLSNETCSSRGTDDKDNTVREIHTEDEDTIEGPFLEAEDLNNDKISDFNDNNVDDMMQFADLRPQANNDNMDAGELFIDAEAFEYLLNQNQCNIVADSGKESLFLKFDPLFAKRLSTDNIAAALNKVQRRQSTPKKNLPPNNRGMAHVDNTTIAGPSTVNATQDVEISNVLDETNEDFNITVTKPMMVVNPAINPVVISRHKPTTPVIANRRSLTFTSPAIAVIDRLLSLSGNESLIGHDTTLADVTREHNVPDTTLTQLRELLADKESNVCYLRSESKELKQRLASLESQMKSLETKSEERLKKINELSEKLNEKTKCNKSMEKIVEECERTIASLLAETEQDKKRHSEERVQLMKERDEQTAHLASMEVSFNDLHSKYEKSKQVIISFKTNEDSCKKAIKEFEENLAKMQTNYELLKQHATSKLNHANEELQKMNRMHESEVLKLNAMIKRKELHITSLEETLLLKTKANEELTAICDELITKVG